jgi:dephospho-CoA kinase
VGAMLDERGAHYLQADALAHQLYSTGEPVYHDEEQDKPDTAMPQSLAVQRTTFVIDRFPPASPSIATFSWVT